MSTPDKKPAKKQPRESATSIPLKDQTTPLENQLGTGLYDGKKGAGTPDNSSNTGDDATRGQAAPDKTQDSTAESDIDYTDLFMV